jgi:VCBS repeat-containing protein
MSAIIGYVSQQEGAAEVIYNNGVQESLASHMSVHTNDVIETGDNGFLVLVLDNGNTLRIGPNQHVILDETVYEEELAVDETALEAEAIKALIEETGDIENLEEAAAGEEGTESSGTNTIDPTARIANLGYAYAEGLDTSFGQFPIAADDLTDTNTALLTSILTATVPASPLDDGLIRASFIDSPVSGLTYTRSSTGDTEYTTGESGVAGEFAFAEGDTITFKVGDVIIAEFPAESVAGEYLFIQDIVTGDGGLSDTNFQQVENIAIFLQLLDSDGDVSNGITISDAVKAAFEGYVDPTTGEALNIAELSGKQMIADAIEHLNDAMGWTGTDDELIYSRLSETDSDREFEDAAMQHVIDYINELGGDRTPAEYDVREPDVINEHGKPITYVYDESGSVRTITFDVRDMLDDGNQVIKNNLVVEGVSLSADQQYIGTLSNDGDIYTITLNDGIDQYDLENLSIDYTVFDWTATVTTSSKAIDLNKSHLSVTEADIVTEGEMSVIKLASTLTFDEDQQLTVKFSPEGLGVDFAEYSDDFIVPIMYRTEAGWQEMTVVGEYFRDGYDKPLPIFGFTMPAGENSIEIGIQTFDDPYEEADVEHIDMLIEGANFYAENLQAGIRDNDPNSDQSGKPIVEVDFAIVSEADMEAVLTFTIVDANGDVIDPALITEPIKVTYKTADLSAEAGKDYDAVPEKTITIPAGTNSYQVSVTINEDDLIENTEFLKLDLTSVSDNAILGDPEASIRIYDNDAINVTGQTNVEGENVVFDVAIKEAMPADAVIQLRPTNSGATATSGDDYHSIAVFDADGNPVVLNPDLTFALNGMTSFTVEYTSVHEDDGVSEGDESVRMQVSASFDQDGEAVQRIGLGTAVIEDKNSPDAVDDTSTTEVDFAIGTTAGSGTLAQWGELNGDGSITIAEGSVTGSIIGYRDGAPADVAFSANDGLGVTGTNNEINLNESIVVQFDNPVSDASVTLDSLGYRFVDQEARVAWKAYDADGNEVAQGTFAQPTSVMQTYTVDGVTFSSLELSIAADSEANFTVKAISATALIDGYATDEDVAITLTAAELLANDTDPEGDTLEIVSVQGATNGSVTFDSVAGTVTFTPNADYFGPASFTYTISDGNGGTDTATVNLYVASVNDLPVITVETDGYPDEDGRLVTNEDVALTIDAADFGVTDVEDGTVTPSLSANNGTVTLDANGNLVYNPDANWFGDDVITVTATDSDGGTTSTTIPVRVLPVNDAPIANDDTGDDVITLGGTANDWGTLEADGTITVNVDGVTGTISGTSALNFQTGTDYGIGSGGNEVDWNENVVMEFDQALSNASIGLGSLYGNYAEGNSAEAEVVWTAYDAGGNVVATGSVKADATNVDGDNKTATSIIEINETFTKVELHTEATRNSNFTVQSFTATVENTILTPEDTPITIDVLANDYDVDGTIDPTTVVITEGPSNGTVVVDPVTGVVTYTPDLNYNGPDSFKYTVADNEGGVSTPATVKLNVGEENDNPTATAAITTATEGGAVVTGTVDPQDVDGTIASVVVDGAAVPGFSIDNTGAFSFDPKDPRYASMAEGETQDIIIPILVTDNNGGTTTTSVTITINGTNDAATVSSASVTLTETDAALTTSGTLTSTDVDNTDNAFTASSTTGTYGDFSIDENGDWTFTANSAFNELNVGQNYSETFNVTSVDGTPSTVTVQINGTNDAATVSSASVTLTETDAALTTSGTLTSTDVDNTDNAFTASSTTGTYGDFSIDENGDWTFTANSAFNELNVGQNYSETFNVTSVDGTPSTVTVQINGTNDAPTVAVQVISATEDIAYTLQLADFGYSDEENDAIAAVQITGLPDNGTLIHADSGAVALDQQILAADIAAGKLTFVSSEHDASATSFDYTVSDGTLWSSEATATVNVAAVADQPTITAAQESTSTQIINRANVTTGGEGFTVEAFDLNGDPATISVISGTDHDGFGVQGAASGADTELGTNGSDSESLVITFDNDVSSVEVAFAWLNSSETAAYTFYKDGIEVGSGTAVGSSDNVDPAVMLQPSNGSAFDQIVFTAPGSGDDYLINSLQFERLETNTGPVTVDANSAFDLNIAAALVDTDGSENLTVALQDIPDGFVITDGTNTFTASAVANSVNISGWDMSNLSVTVSNVTSTQTFTLRAVATATESSNSDSASNSVDIPVTVNYTGVPVLSGDSADVYESAMTEGTDSASAGEIATGNLFDNDAIPTGAFLSNVAIAGGTTDTSVAGQITVTTAEGNTLVANTQTGVYTYTLVNAVDHYSITEVPNTQINDTTNPFGTLTGGTSDNELIDYGVGHANQTVTVTLQVSVNDSLFTGQGWDEGNDTLTVTGNGITRTIQDDGTITFNTSLDSTGRLDLSVINGANNSNETATITAFSVTGTQNAITYTPNESVTDNFTYTVEDINGAEYNSTLDVTIHDDAPVGTSPQFIDVVVEPVVTNLSVIVDGSGSMDSTDMQLTLNAINTLFSEFSALGTVNFNLVVFKADGNTTNSGWSNSVADITLQGGGGTDIEAGLQSVVTTSFDGTQPSADQNVVYFFGDGNDNSGGSLDTYLPTWSAFVNSGAIDKLFTYSVNTDSVLTDIAKVADNGENEVSPDAVNISNISALSDAVSQTVDIFSGSLTNDAYGNAMIDFGADDGHIASITIGANTVNYDEANPVQTITGSDGHGSFEINFDTGAFRYVPSDTTDYTESIEANIVDNDGDSLGNTVLLEVNVQHTETHAYSGADLDAGTGFDIMTLGADADLNFDNVDNISNIEKIDLDATGDHQLLNLNAQDVISMTDSDNELFIDGDTADQVTLGTDLARKTDENGNNVTSEMNGHIYDVYTNIDQNGNELDQVTLHIEQNIQHS